MHEKEHILIVGGGSIGERHVRCFLKTGRVRVSLCDTSDAVRKRLAEQYPLQHVCRNLDGALGESYDLAVVATPAHLHVEMARRLMDARCHVLIEKPLSTSTMGIAELMAAAKEAGRAVGVAYVLHHNPGLVALREKLQTQMFGPPLELVCTSGQDFAALRPAYREIYYRDHKTGGGAIQDALVHLVNAAEWLVGPTTSVVADAAHLALEGVTVEDTVHVLARHGEILSSYAFNQHQPPNETTLSVNCRDGTLRWDPPANRWMAMRRGKSEWQVFDYDFPETDTGFIAQAHAFLDAAAGQTEPACTLDEAAQTLRTCLAILDSSQRRAWVEVGQCTER